MRLCHLAYGLVVLAACPAPQVTTTSTAPYVVETSPPRDAAELRFANALEPAPPVLRLPKNFVPSSYDARLAIDPARPTFDGEITIHGEVSERSSVIWLHGRHLTTTRAVATRGDPDETPSGVTSQLSVTARGEDLLELRADPPLEPGSWLVTLEYTGEIDVLNTTGAFKETAGGEPYVYTQFEAIYARRVFPCVDEPDSKVPWQLALEIPNGLVAVSNTPVVREVAAGKRATRIEFARTKPLPSYLIAFGVGPFAIVDAGKTTSGTPVRIIAMKGRTAETAWAAKTTPRLLELLEDWFGIPYPYEKLDILAIPLTVGFGAMENAGLVTAAERLVLVDPKQPSWERRHTWVLVASHELAHQWFGDYVTTAWWDDVWLNEGFANWMENKIAARFEPAWHDQLAELEMRFGALQADSVISARRIRQPIDSTDDILNAFDGITYNKGGSVLNMFESYIGPELFQRGVREYMKARAFGNATSADFVAAISAAAGKELAPAFATFLDQSGEPELTTTIACDRRGPRIELSQQRYVIPGSPEPAAGTPWILPVCIAYERAGKRVEACTLLDHPTGTITLPAGAPCPRWVMSNVNGRGYYRTQMTASQVTALRDEAWPVLSWTERRALFFDVAEAVRIPTRATRQPPAVTLPLVLALSLVPRMMTGGDRFTVGDALGLPVGLDRFVADDQRAKYEAWMRSVFGPGVAALGMAPKPGDDLDAEAMRADLYRATAWSGRDPELVKQAVELAREWRELPRSIRRATLAVAVDASPELGERILHDVKTETDRSRRTEMLEALAAVRDPKRVAGAFQLMLGSSSIPGSGLPSTGSGLIDLRETMRMLFATSTEATRQVAETFFREHKDELMKRLPQDEVSGGVTGITTIFAASCDGTRRDEITAYLTKNFGSLAGGDRVVKQVIEGMDQCIASRNVLAPEIRVWLGGVKLPRPKLPANHAAKP